MIDESIPHEKVRVKVTGKEILASRYNDMTPAQKATLPRDYFEYRPKLHKNLTLPSYVHGYSLAIEYMRKWFLSKFSDDYFKVIHVNGKHVLDDWRNFNNYNIRREKPMLAIVPTVEFDYDRENVDMYQGGAALMLKQTDFQQSFLKDYESDTFLYLRMRALKMNFNFHIRVNSRSEQLDLMNKMELWFRIGSTQHEYINAEFHIPYDIMLNIAVANNFDVVDDKIVDVLDFLSYLNKHSYLPIIFKMRAINQKPEFFLRANDLYTHISCLDKLSIDDGEREGKLETNFNIEMQATLTIPIPHFYAYMSQQPITREIGINESNGKSIGIYSINEVEIPPKNDVGWMELVTTCYVCEKGEDHIDLTQLLMGGSSLTTAVKFCKSNFISPATFMEVSVYRSEDIYKGIKYRMNYDDNTLYFDKPFEGEEAINITIYADNEYINNAVVSMGNLDKSRFVKSSDD